MKNYSRGLLAGARLCGVSRKVIKIKKVSIRNVSESR